MADRSSGSNSVLVFEVPLSQRLGDVALAVVLAPLAAVTLGLLAGLAALVGALLMGVREQPDVSQVAVAGGLLGFPLFVLALRPHGFWRVRFGSRAVHLGGRLLGRRVRYEDVLFLRARKGQRVHWRHGEHRQGLLIDAGWPKRYTIHLTGADSHSCLLELHRRCPRAAALDAEGRSYLPTDPRHVSAARRRLGRFWITAGVAGLGFGAVLLFVCVWGVWLLVTGETGGVRPWTGVFGGLLAACVFIDGGRRSVRRGRSWLVGD